MTSESEQKYKGAFWKFIAGVLMISFSMLSIAFFIACYIIATGGPSLDDVQKVHEAALKSEGYTAQSVKQDEPSKNETTLYDLLSIDRDADMNELRSSYLQAAEASHPNISRNNNALGRKAFIHLAEAYQTLSDTQKRMKYDHSLTDGQIEKKSDVLMSMDEAIRIFEDVKEQRKQPAIGAIIKRFQSLIGKINPDEQEEDHEESRVGIPSFPMVARMVKMMGGPRIRAFKVRTRHRIRISKMCVNGLCRITVAHQVLKLKPKPTPETQSLD